MPIIRRQIEDLTNWLLRVFLLVLYHPLMRSRSDEPVMLNVQFGGKWADSNPSNPKRGAKYDEGC